MQYVVGCTLWPPLWLLSIFRFLTSSTSLLWAQTWLLQCRMECFPLSLFGIIILGWTVFSLSLSVLFSQLHSFPSASSYGGFTSTSSLLQLALFSLCSWELLFILNSGWFKSPPRSKLLRPAAGSGWRHRTPFASSLCSLQFHSPDPQRELIPRRDESIRFPGGDCVLLLRNSWLHWNGPSQLDSRPSTWLWFWFG